MTLFHLAQASEFPPHNKNTMIKKSIIRGGKWLVKEGILHTEKGSKINWAMERSACVYFTLNYFIVSASLARIVNIDIKNRDFWKRESIELLRYVRTDLWYNTFKEKEGPFRLSEAGLVAGYSFFGQSLAWALYYFDDLITQMGWF